MATAEAERRAVTPKRFQREWARTHFLRISRKDWSLVEQGRKTEYRVYAARGPVLRDLKPPTPIIIYSPPSGFGGPELRKALMVCEDAWREPLGSISPKSLAAEGFDSYGEFRTYWRNRFRDRHHNPGRFNPLTEVTVLALRPWKGDEDFENLGRLVLERLYVNVLDAAE